MPGVRSAGTSAMPSSRLVDATPCATPFSAWAFHRAWWDAYGANAHEQTLVAYEGDELLGIVPLMHRHEVEPGEELRESAKRLLRVHDLRTADALQLAAAVYVAEARPSTLEFVSLDDRLLAAARREGFPTTKPAP